MVENLKMKRIYHKLMKVKKPTVMMTRRRRRKIRRSRVVVEKEVKKMKHNSNKNVNNSEINYM